MVPFSILGAEIVQLPGCRAALGTIHARQDGAARMPDLGQARRRDKDACEFRGVGGGRTRRQHRGGARQRTRKTTSPDARASKA
jgi:hypothetical protein